MFENGTLKNRGNTWQPDGIWIFTNASEKNMQSENWIRIKNKVDNKTLVGFGSKAIANETFVEGRHIQLWKRGQPDNEGYYTLQNSESQKFITADTYSLELRGKCIRGRSQTTFTKFGFFDHLPPSVYIFYGIKVYKKSFFDHLPPSSCKRSL